MNSVDYLFLYLPVAFAHFFPIRCKEKNGKQYEFQPVFLPKEFMFSVA